MSCKIKVPKGEDEVRGRCRMKLNRRNFIGTGIALERQEVMQESFVHKKLYFVHRLPLWSLTGSNMVQPDAHGIGEKAGSRQILVDRLGIVALGFISRAARPSTSPQIIKSPRCRKRRGVWLEDQRRCSFCTLRTSTGPRLQNKIGDNIWTARYMIALLDVVPRALYHCTQSECLNSRPSLSHKVPKVCKGYREMYSQKWVRDDPITRSRINLKEQDGATSNSNSRCLLQLTYP